MFPTARIILSGDVQKHAFRKHVRRLAVKHNLFGLVQNLKDYKRSVEVVCQGSKDDVVLFIKDLESLKNSEKDSNLMLVDIESITPPSWDTQHPVEYKDFEIIRSYDEAGERFDEGVEQLIKLRVETTTNFEVMDTKYGAISATMKELKTEPLEDRKQMKELAKEIIGTQKLLANYITSQKQ